ncbi:MAG: calcium/sodium antiporter [Bacteroidota bacterium]|nr:calcium/sodium antiporter [Bacteroidota bacterium]
MQVFFFIFGLVLLYLGGEALVRGAVSISSKLRISTLVVGLTIISFATSAPELFVSLQAAFEGKSNIAFGNVIGSSIANIALVLGITAMIFRVNISHQTLKFNYPVMLLSSVALASLLYFSNGLSTTIGFVFIGVLTLFLAYLFKQPKLDREANSNQEKEKASSLFKSIGLILLGVLLLKFGADWLVEGTIYLAKSLEISDRIIAVTLVAIGTSIPELATSIVAALKKEEDLAVGNLIGSNIFNVLAVLGVTAVICPLTVDDAQIIFFDIPWMLGISFALGILIYAQSKYVISRKEGAFLLSLYLIYILLLISK